MVDDKQNIGSGFTVWIDLDDTLWDFSANSRVALRGLYADYDLRRWFPTAEAWIECYEKHNHYLWDRYNNAAITKEFLMAERFKRPLLEVGSPMAEEYGRRFDSEYLDRLAECTLLIDGAVELLEWLRGKGYKTGILSNGFTEVQYRKIRNSGLESFIDYVVLSDEVGVNKPDVVIYRHAERVCGCDAGHCVMIGDNLLTDIAGAVRAGWKAVYFTRGGSDAELVPTVRRLMAVGEAPELFLPGRF